MGMINQISVSCSDPDIIHSSYVEQMSPVHVYIQIVQSDVFLASWLHAGLDISSGK